MSDLYTEEIVKKRKNDERHRDQGTSDCGNCSNCFVTDGSWVVIYYSDHCICSSGLFYFANIGTGI